MVFSMQSSGMSQSCRAGWAPTEAESDVCNLVPLSIREPKAFGRREGSETIPINDGPGFVLQRRAVRATVLEIVSHFQLSRLPLKIRPHTNHPFQWPLRISNTVVHTISCSSPSY